MFFVVVVVVVFVLFFSLLRVKGFLLQVNNVLKIIVRIFLYIENNRRKWSENVWILFVFLEICFRIFP